MNCQSFRKFVGAFADGELDTPTNAAALEHLNMCPACAKRVTEVHRMKESLARVFGADAAPPELAARIRASIRNQQPAAAAKPGWWVHRLFVPMSAAAALVVAVTVWQFRGSEGDATLAPDAPAVVAGQLASQARTQHDACRVHGPNHHDETLGRDLDGIARRLTERLKLEVIAPDLAAFGFELLGADACGIEGRSGAHVLYQADDGPQLSVFSVALPDCRRVSFEETTRRGTQEGSAERPDSLSVVAWSKGCATYVICSEIPAEQLSRIVDAVRVE